MSQVDSDQVKSFFVFYEVNFFLENLFNSWSFFNSQLKHFKKVEQVDSLPRALHTVRGRALPQLPSIPMISLDPGHLHLECLILVVTYLPIAILSVSMS